MESLLLLSQQHQQQSENPGCYKLKLFIFNASLHPSHCLYDSPSSPLLTFSCNIICVFVPRREVYVISEKMKIGIIFKKRRWREVQEFFIEQFFILYSVLTHFWTNRHFSMHLRRSLTSFCGSRIFILRPHSCMTLQISQTLHAHKQKSSVKCNHFLKLLFPHSLTSSLFMSRCWLVSSCYFPIFENISVLSCSNLINYFDTAMTLGAADNSSICLRLCLFFVLTFEREERNWKKSTFKVKSTINFNKFVIFHIIML